MSILLFYESENRKFCELVILTGSAAFSRRPQDGTYQMSDEEHGRGWQELPAQVHQRIQTAHNCSLAIAVYISLTNKYTELR